MSLASFSKTRLYVGVDEMSDLSSFVEAGCKEAM